MATATATMLDETSFDFISDLVRQRSAIVLERSKMYLVESRLTPIVKEKGLLSLAELITRLRGPNSEPLIQRIVEAMTTNETSFFRDIHPFNALGDRILPELLKSRAATRTLNIWSNACSTGQEAFSIAMMIQAQFPELLNWNLNILATDISTQILAKAKKGAFNQTEVSRGLPTALLTRFFTRTGMTWSLKPEVLNMVKFRELNLIDPFPSDLPTMDVVFLRNVLIYFDPDTKSEILRRVQKKMAPDGCLFLGGAESIMNLNVPFKKKTIENAACFNPL